MGQATKASRGQPQPTLRDALEAEATRHMGLANFTGIGIGPKIRGGEVVADEAVIFYVTRKLGDRAEVLLAGSGMVSDTVVLLGKSYPTDVVEDRWLKSDAGGLAAAVREARRRLDPVVAGASIGTSPGETGTIGAIVRDRRSGAPAALTCWHVIAVPGMGGVVQPGLDDDLSSASNRLGRALRPLIGPDGDAAIASIEGRAADSRIIELGVRVERVAMPKEGDIVAKMGRTTGVSKGRVRLLLATHYWNVPPKRSDAILTRVFWIQPLTTSDRWEPGDSGAAWMLCDAAGRPTSTMVGLHMARSTSTGAAVACFAPAVFAALEIEPLTVGAGAGGAVLPAPGGAGAIALDTRPGRPHRVIATVAAVRRFPFETAEVVGQCFFGDVVHVMARSGDWQLVDTGGPPGVDGCVFKDFLEAL
jgi:endonuclease G, mitochondrial